MFFRQVLYRDLGCASYMLGCGGAAVVVDPRWDVEVYLQIALEEGLQITHAIETHDHADHVSGRFRLAAATGAHCIRPAVEHEDRSSAIARCEEITFGSVCLRALASPGHRPEHLAFAVIDRKRADDPWMILTGDSLLVGDLARPDLAVDANGGARALHRSLGELMALGDHVEVWPAHVGGSLCVGAALSAKTSSTIGFERLHNPLLRIGEVEFVRRLTAGTPARPPNVEQVLAINQAGTQQQPEKPLQLNCEAQALALRTGIAVLDARAPTDFDAGHLAGAINLPARSPGVGTRAGWALSHDQPILIAAQDPEQAMAMASALHAVGLWRTIGYAIADSWAWEQLGLPVARAASWDLDQLAARVRANSVDLVDVRESSEWCTGHVSGSHHMPLRKFRVGEPYDLPNSALTTAVACAAGVRAAFAASLLRRAGRQDVVRVAGGGVPDLREHGIHLEASA